MTTDKEEGLLRVMDISIPKEILTGEKRVAITPEGVEKLVKSGNKVLIEKGAGSGSMCVDEEYLKKGGVIEDRRDVVFNGRVVVKINPPKEEEVELLKEGSYLISYVYDTINDGLFKSLVKRKVNVLALELIPRISKAQSMDILSSMSSIAGYKAVLIAANHLGKYFPMMMTAAGTVSPAKVFIMGAGVAGLQAIATAKRLGAMVEAYDVRPAVKEQVESLGAKFVQLKIETKDAQDIGGYAKAQSEDFYKKQQELLVNTVAQSDVVITTALVPGKRAPILVTADAVKKMKPGSVVVDLAAEQGGNCELTKPGEEIVVNGVVVSGLKNITSMVAGHASQLFSRNVLNFYQHVFKNGEDKLDLNDEIVKSTLISYRGDVLKK